MAAVITASEKISSHRSKERLVVIAVRIAVSAVRGQVSTFDISTVMSNVET